MEGKARGKAIKKTILHALGLSSSSCEMMDEVQNPATAVPISKEAWVMDVARPTW